MSLEALKWQIWAKIRKVDQGVIDLLRSIKHNIVKTVNVGPYATFRWIYAYLPIFFACLGNLAFLINILLQFGWYI